MNDADRVPVMLSVDEYMDVIAAIHFFRTSARERPMGLKPEQDERLRLLHIRLRQEALDGP